MARRLRPDAWVAGVQELTPEWLAERGIDTVLVDLDNTLAEWKAWQLPAGSVSWLDRLRSDGIRVCLLSNSRKPSRVRHLADAHRLPYVAWAGKPRRGGFRRALAHLGAASTDGVAMVGDQLFTDIYGARRAGVYAVLVEPLSPREFAGTKLLRRFERGLLAGRGMRPPASPDRGREGTEDADKG
ncbi:MAG: YqeG family HAD IIIA-type phosphatase [Armatimonadetes bacterium]|nr:YqeG family HAD IIIA-type phosphatase [Armatimonadota bacterium]